MTDDGVRSLHEAIRGALEEDDRIPEGKPKRYGAREFSDFRRTADLFETELERRGLDFEKINW